MRSLLCLYEYACVCLFGSTCVARIHPTGGWPADLTVYEIASAGGLIRWLVVVPAADHAIALPDLTALSDVEVPSGPLVVGLYGGRVDDFDYGTLSYAQLRPSGMAAYGLDYFNAHR